MARTIVDLKRNETATVKKIEGGYGLKRKLNNMGLRVGSRVKKVTSQFVRGPITVRTGGTQMAIGYGMAKKIIIEDK
ncbi:MAG: ferrous iron transport protein A [Candidatus Cloacimonetes bacterium]|nr:ferrous iron transport protein A [Candidatus Cloacimonadota bacterium]MBS3768150.1 ferrous iron transport protein A [Candidatus Cloacimonadota bacterium]